MLQFTDIQILLKYMQIRVGSIFDTFVKVQKQNRPQIALGTPAIFQKNILKKTFKNVKIPF